MNQQQNFLDQVEGHFTCTSMNASQVIYDLRRRLPKESYMANSMTLAVTNKLGFEIGRNR